jgi:hypothetical protein
MFECSVTLRSFDSSACPINTGVDEQPPREMSNAKAIEGEKRNRGSLAVGGRMCREAFGEGARGVSARSNV